MIHPTAIIDEKVRIGRGTLIWHWVHVCRGAHIGRNCILGQNVYIGPNVYIGDNVKIQNNVSVYEYVFVQDDVFIGPSVVFTNVKYPRIGKLPDFKVTNLMRGCVIGANSTIVCGTEIGAGAFVGAGSVVTRDVPDGAIVWGSPARKRHELSTKQSLLECSRRIERLLRQVMSQRR